MIEKELHFPQVTMETTEGPKATIKTNHGDLKFQLFPEQAPKTVANLSLYQKMATMMESFFTGLSRIS